MASLRSPTEVDESRVELWQGISKYYDIGDFETFNRKMDIPASRRRFYDQVSQGLDIGTFEEFEAKIAPHIRTVQTQEQGLFVPTTQAIEAEETQRPTPEQTAEFQQKARRFGTPEFALAQEQARRVIAGQAPSTQAFFGAPKPEPFAFSTELPDVETVARIAKGLGEEFVSLPPVIQRGLMEGAVVEIPRMLGQATRFVGEKTGLGTGLGKAIGEFSEDVQKTLFGPPLEPKPLSMTAATYEGSRMALPSVLPALLSGGLAQMFLGAAKTLTAAQKASIATQIASATSGALYGLSQAQFVEELARERNVKPGISPYVSGGIEAIGEYFGTKYLGRLLGLDEGAFKLALDQLGKTFGVELTTEMLQAGGQALTDVISGVRPEANPIDEMVAVVGPTAFMTLMTTGVGAAGTGLRQLAPHMREIVTGLKEKLRRREKLNETETEFIKQNRGEFDDEDLVRAGVILDPIPGPILEAGLGQAAPPATTPVREYISRIVRQQGVTVPEETTPPMTDEEVIEALRGVRTVTGLRAYTDEEIVRMSGEQRRALAEGREYVQPPAPVTPPSTPAPKKVTSPAADTYLALVNKGKTKKEQITSLPDQSPVPEGLRDVVVFTGIQENKEGEPTLLRFQYLPNRADFSVTDLSQFADAYRRAREVPLNMTKEAEHALERGKKSQRATEETGVIASAIAKVNKREDIGAAELLEALQYGTVGGILQRIEEGRARKEEEAPERLQRIVDVLRKEYPLFMRKYPAAEPIKPTAEGAGEPTGASEEQAGKALLPEQAREQGYRRVPASYVPKEGEEVVDLRNERGEYLGKAVRAETAKAEEREGVKPSAESKEETKAEEIPPPPSGGAIATAPAARQIVELPLTEVDVDVARFQPRVGSNPETGLTQEREEFLRERAKKFDRAKTEENPIIVWRDPKDNRFKILAGHGRRFLFLQAGERTIPAIEFKGTEAEAIERAQTENIDREAQDVLDNVAYIRNLRAQGMPMTSVEEEATARFKKNANLIVSLSFLNPDGKALQAVVATGAEATEAERDALTMARWLGRVRRENKQLTDNHERELYDFLKENYKTAGRKFTSVEAFMEFVEKLIDKRSVGGVLDPSTSLNPSNIVPSSSAEFEYDRRVSDALATYNKLLGELQAKRAQLIQGGGTMEQIDRILAPLQNEVLVAKAEWDKLKKERDVRIQQIRDIQQSLFDNNVRDIQEEGKDVSQAQQVVDNGDYILEQEIENLRTRLKSLETQAATALTDEENARIAGEISALLLELAEVSAKRAARPVILALQAIKPMTPENLGPMDIAIDRGAEIYRETVEGKFTQEQLKAARSQLMQAGVRQSVIDAVERATPKPGPPETPEPDSALPPPSPPASTNQIEEAIQDLDKLFTSPSGGEQEHPSLPAVATRSEFKFRPGESREAQVQARIDELRAEIKKIEEQQQSGLFEEQQQGGLSEEQQDLADRKTQLVQELRILNTKILPEARALDERIARARKQRQGEMFTPEEAGSPQMDMFGPEGQPKVEERPSTRLFGARSLLDVFDQLMENPDFKAYWKRRLQEGRQNDYPVWRRTVVAEWIVGKERPDWTPADHEKWNNWLLAQNIGERPRQPSGYRYPSPTREQPLAFLKNASLVDTKESDKRVRYVYEVPSTTTESTYHVFTYAKDREGKVQSLRSYKTFTNTPKAFSSAGRKKDLEYAIAKAVRKDAPIGEVQESWGALAPTPGRGEQVREGEVSYEGLNELRYQKAKYHFDKIRVALGEAGTTTIEQFVHHISSRWGKAAQPYIDRYLAEVEDEFDFRRGQAVFGTTGRTGSFRRPSIRYVNAGNLPEPREIVAAGKYEIDEHQRIAVNLILTRFEQAKGPFLLGDGTGVGKTRPELVVAWEQATRSGKPSLIITNNKQIIETRFEPDAKMLGVQLGKTVQLFTYDDLRTGKVPNENWGTIIFDEAHALKHVSSGRSRAAYKLRGDHFVYATATPMDSAHNAAYFLSKITGIREEEVQNMLGYKIIEYEDSEGEIHRQPVLLESYSWPLVFDNIIKLRDVAIKNGAMIRREYPFYGTTTTVPIELSAVALEEQAAIESYWSTLLDATPVHKRKNIAGQRIQELSRWVERHKIDAVFDSMMKDLDEGKRVIVVAERVNPTIVKGLGGQESPGTITILGEKLKAANIPFAKIYGDKSKAGEVRKFQNDEVKVALMTPRSGGTGIDLDDVGGNRPRVMYIMTANFSGDVFDQILGRGSRRNTASPIAVRFIYAPASISDLRRAEILEKKLGVLKRIQSGEDPDVVGFGEWEGEIEEIIGEGDTTPPDTLASVAETRPAPRGIETLTMQSGVPAPENEEGMSDFLVSERVKEVLKRIGLRYVAERYIPNRYLGLYNARRKDIRVKSLFDVFVAAHEGMHHISNEYGIGKRLLREVRQTKTGKPIYDPATERLRNRLTDIYVEFYPKARRRHEAEKRIEEGIAVLIEEYLYQPDYVMEKYPDLVSAFIRPDGEYYHPMTTELLDGLAKIIGDYGKLSHEQRIGARIVFGQAASARDKGFNWKQRLYFELKSIAEPLKRYGEMVGVTPDENPWYFFEGVMLFKNSIISNWLSGKRLYTLKADNNWRVDKGSVAKLERMTRGKQREFNEYLVARRIIADHNRLANLEAAYSLLDEDERKTPEGKKLQKQITELEGIIARDNFSLQDAVATQRKFAEEFRKAEQLFDRINSALVDWMEVSGLISRETANLYRSNEGYASFQRHITDEFIVPAMERTGGKVATSKPRATKSRVGSQLDLLPPTFNQAIGVIETINKALDAMMWQRMAAIADKYGEIGVRFAQTKTVRVFDETTGKWVYRVAGASGDPFKDPNLVPVWSGGKPTFYKVAPEFRALVESLGPQNLGVVAEVLRIGSALFTRLTTSANPFWALGNLTVDQLTASAQTKTGFIPIVDPAKSFVAFVRTLFTEEETMARTFLSTGGRRQTFASQFELTPEQYMRKLASEKTKFEKLAHGVDIGVSIFELPSNVSEWMSRFAEYRRAKEQGMSDVVAMAYANEVTIPFAHKGHFGGKAGQALRNSIAYLNAATQVTVKFWETVKDNPARVATILAGLTTAALFTAVYAMTAASDKQRRILMQTQVKDLTRKVFLPHPDGESWVTLRIPEWFGSVTALAYLFVIQHYGGNKVRFKEFVEAITGGVPQQFNITEPPEAVLSWTPQFGRGFVQIMTNVRMYPNLAPVIPESMKRLPIEQQYDEYTSQLAREFGPLIGVPPKAIDFWIKEQFGPMAQFFAGGRGPRNPMARQEENIILAGRAFSSFYRQKEAVDEQYARLKFRHSFRPEEVKEIIKTRYLYDRVDDAFSELRTIAQAGGTVSESMRQNALNVLLAIQNYEDVDSLIEKIRPLMNQLGEDIGKEAREKKIPLLMRPFYTPGAEEQYPYAFPR
jgi:hypothetical protein